MAQGLFSYHVCKYSWSEYEYKYIASEYEYLQFVLEYYSVVPSTTTLQRGLDNAWKNAVG